MLPVIWQCFQLSGRAANYLAGLPAIWQCCWLSGNSHNIGRQTDMDTGVWTGVRWHSLTYSHTLIICSHTQLYSFTLTHLFTLDIICMVVKYVSKHWKVPYMCVFHFMANHSRVGVIWTTTDLSQHNLGRHTDTDRYPIYCDCWSYANICTKYILSFVTNGIYLYVIFEYKYWPVVKSCTIYNLYSIWIERNSERCGHHLGGI